LRDPVVAGFILSGYFMFADVLALAGGQMPLADETRIVPRILEYMRHAPLVRIRFHPVEHDP
jgi:hypothetical protein